ncbi:perilipin-3-like [Antechinus flavipes]|uniref:perilipin-3-like n=1 Tax=Antechinus flavipes TaxID=38775 RepID=UPI002235F4B6|nr:perilipin-3-like [Antechinus flavipes]
MDHTYAIGNKTFHISGTTTSPSPMKKIVSDLMLSDAKHIVAKLNSKISSESIKEERMSTPQEPVQQEKPYSYKETIFDKTQSSKEIDSLMNTSNGALNKEDDKSHASEEERLLTEIQEEKRTLEELKGAIDKYLPLSLNMANIPESSKEDEDYYGEDSGKDEDCFILPGSLPSNLQPQTYKTLKENIRSARNNIRKFLYQLYETIELTYQSMQDSGDQKNCHKALFELWIEWSKSQSENADDTQLLETRTLGMSSNIALKLHSAFMDLMPKIQGLPNSLQDKLQQACFDMQDLHTTFAISNGFGDLDKRHLIQSQFKLTQAQKNIEELFCFLEDDMPSGWIIGPISPSEYPLLEGVTLPKEKES